MDVQSKVSLDWVYLTLKKMYIGLIDEDEKSTTVQGLMFT